MGPWLAWPKGWTLHFAHPVSDRKFFDNIRIERLNDNRFPSDKKGDNTRAGKVEPRFGVKLEGD